jgi:uncharacterized protein with NRDE domain
MCLAALAIDAHPRFPLVLAANRDELFDRAADKLAWWRAEQGGHEILGGRDLSAGGTWLSLSRAGRLAFVTNVRNPADRNPAAPSRGSIVPLWLRGDLSMNAFWSEVDGAGFNGFNLIAGDLLRGEFFWGSNRAPSPRLLEPGVHGVSNALLDTPWPKVRLLNKRLSDALQPGVSVETLADSLFAALADRAEAPDEELPHTGVGLELERRLSPAFIGSPDGLYGTRCSTVIVSERTEQGCVTHIIERSFDSTGRLVAVTSQDLDHLDVRDADLVEGRPALDEA